MVIYMNLEQAKQLENRLMEDILFLRRDQAFLSPDERETIDLDIATIKKRLINVMHEYEYLELINPFIT